MVTCNDFKTRLPEDESCQAESPLNSFLQYLEILSRNRGRKGGFFFGFPTQLDEAGLGGF